MSFNSVEYLLFVPLTALCTGLIPPRFRWVVLLLASWYFYLALKQFVLLEALLAVTAVTWGCGLAVGSAAGERVRRFAFWGGIAGNLLVLSAMKYVPPAAGEINSLLGRIGLPFSFPLKAIAAIGVSYVVFQAISYLIDLRLETTRPERHPGIFALYLAFFPKLLQGPIERAEELMPQLRKPVTFDPENIRAGLTLFGWGLLKKAVVADRLAIYVNQAYGDLPGHAGLPLLAATWLYALQLYYDFSGYTDMALGTGQLFGIRLTQNFNAPYGAASIAEFWRRWHISFSRWLLDYLFKPLQIVWRDGRNFGTAAALLVTFLISGLWHGATGPFLVWGLLHGLYLAASVWYRPVQKKLHRKLGVEKSPWLRRWQVFLTFNLVCFAWIFFRSPTLNDAWFVVTHLFGQAGELRGFLFGNGLADPLIAAGGLAFIVLANRRQPSDEARETGWMRWGVPACLVLLLLLFNSDSNAGFIYFRF